MMNDDLGEGRNGEGGEGKPASGRPPMWGQEEAMTLHCALLLATLLGREGRRAQEEGMFPGRREGRPAHFCPQPFPNPTFSIILPIPSQVTYLFYYKSSPLPTQAQ